MQPERRLDTVNRFYTKAFDVLSKAADLVCLNILWFLTSLPIFTLGASTCALYESVMKVLADEGTVTRNYFRAFKKNFRQGTCAWLIFLAIELVLAGDMFILLNYFSKTPAAILWIPLLLSLVIFSAAAVYVFPLIVRYENTLKQHLKNALVLAVTRLIYTIPLTIVTLGSLFISYILFPMSLMLWVFFAASLIVFTNLFIFRSLFRELEGADEGESENR